MFDRHNRPPDVAGLFATFSKKRMPKGFSPNNVVNISRFHDTIVDCKKCRNKEIRIPISL